MGSRDVVLGLPTKQRGEEGKKEIHTTGSSPSVCTRNSFTKSPKPCHTIISTNGYEIQFVYPGSTFDRFTLANGWGNACVGVYGNVNIRCTGIPSASAQ